LALIIRI